MVRLRDFRLVADRILDLSESGMLVGPADPVLTGESVLITFESPIFHSWIDAEATVARVIHGRRPGEHLRGLGIEIERMDGLSRTLLEQHLRSLPVAPPRWRPGRRRTGNATALLAALSGGVAA